MALPLIDTNNCALTLYRLDVRIANALTKEKINTSLVGHLMKAKYKVSKVKEATDAFYDYLMNA